MASMRRRKVLCPSRCRWVSGRLLRAWYSWAAARLKAAMVSGSGVGWGESGGGVAGVGGGGFLGGEGVVGQVGEGWRGLRGAGSKCEPSCPAAGRRRVRGGREDLFL